MKYYTVVTMQVRNNSEMETIHLHRFNDGEHIYTGEQNVIGEIDMDKNGQR